MKSILTTLCSGLLLVLASGAALAQIKPPGESPAVEAAAEPAISTDRDGTTVVGDRESPIGLYITPWRNDAPEAELDRPARFLEEQLLPIDADVFRRQLEYYNTITEHLRLRSSGNLGAQARQSAQ